MQIRGRSHIVNRYIDSWEKYFINIFDFNLRSCVKYFKNYLTFDMNLLEELIMSGHETCLTFKEYVLQNWGKEGLLIINKLEKYRYE